MKLKTLLVVTIAAAISVNVFPQTLRILQVNVVSPAAPSPEAYGTAAQSIATVEPWEFFPTDTTTTVGWNGIYKYITAGPYILAPVHLPSGSLITGIELEACDTDAANQVLGAFFECGDVLSCGTSNTVGTGGAATPGCARFPLTLSTPVTIANGPNKYFLYITTGSTSTTSFGAVRVLYKRQISPAPGTATFSDVPTSHPFFQYIEALAASGITAGCAASPPQYCPDAPLTRGQMAVFLSRALGLHFPN